VVAVEQWLDTFRLCRSVRRRRTNSHAYANTDANADTVTYTNANVAGVGEQHARSTGDSDSR
jgi:hypothetical protein